MIKLFEAFVNEIIYNVSQNISESVSSFKNEFEKLREKYISDGINAYNNNDTKECATIFENFYKELIQLIEPFSTKHLKISKVELKSSNKVVDYGYEVVRSSKNVNFKPRYRKNSDFIFDPIFILITATYTDVDSTTLRDHGYGDELYFAIGLNPRKDGTLHVHRGTSSNGSIPHHALIPPDFKEDVVELMNFLNAILMADNNSSIFDKFDLHNFLGHEKDTAPSIYDSLDVNTIIHNSIKGNNMSKGVAVLLKSIAEALTKIDKNCKLEIGDSKSISLPSNIYIGTAATARSQSTFTAKLTFFGKDHYFISQSESDAQSHTVSVSFDNIEHAIGGREDRYSVGVWVGGKYWVSDEIGNILQKDVK